MRPQFVTFGDSITQRGFSPGWTGTLADTYQRRADIINRGYSGYNTRWALHLLPHIFPLPPTNAAAAAAAPPPPRLVTVWFGANDAALPDRASARQHVPLPEYRANLDAIVAHLRACGVPAIVLITPPPVSEPDRIVHVKKTYGVDLKDPERTNEVAGLYTEAVQGLAADLGLPCLNLWTAFQAVPRWQQDLLCDGLHLTPAGQQEAYRLLQQLINDTWPDLTVSALPMDAPYHSWIDPEQPGAAFDKHFGKKDETCGESPAPSSEGACQASQ
ncbi:GDSL esterase lipase [Micractinium conductrix]|uniref:GDSL esterase lipase n=1 Tax=Micractinium conductrix TaxID=554055 RepID=A0A2P6VPG1_9CHLO|nr:GDSL esterase lipase [Micractinium conductrix]|eukprot:PSC75981.1 GDSL esterase lipase [Micractinium conductrix]